MGLSWQPKDTLTGWPRGPSNSTPLTYELLPHPTSYLALEGDHSKPRVTPMTCSPKQPLANLTGLSKMSPQGTLLYHSSGQTLNVPQCYLSGCCSCPSPLYPFTTFPLPDEEPCGPSPGMSLPSALPQPAGPCPAPLCSPGSPEPSLAELLLLYQLSLSCSICPSSCHPCQLGLSPLGSRLPPLDFSLWSETPPLLATLLSPPYPV
jgi:hypothetical protein